MDTPYRVFLPMASDDQLGRERAQVDARELDAAYVLIRDADETLQIVMSAARQLERNADAMLVLLRVAQHLLGHVSNSETEVRAWMARRDAFMSVKLPAKR